MREARCRLPPRQDTPVTLYPDGQMLLVRGPPRLRDGLMRALCAAALTAGCSGGSSASHAGQTLDGGLNSSSPGIALASRVNALIKQNHDAQCAACQPCGGFSPGSDVCLGAAIDTYPQAKPGVVCQIASEEHALTCLTRATTCDAVNQCRDTQKGESMACPKY